MTITTRAIDNTADVIDSRDIVARIEALREAVEAHTADDHDTAELAALEAFAAEAEPYCADWHHGETLIRDSYFVDYVQELLADCGDIPRDLPFYVVIDWEATARNIRYDYTGVDFAGVTYWVR